MVYLIIVDPHLGSKVGDLQVMLQFLKNLPPKKYHLIWLGDVFDVWAGFEAWHSTEMQDFLKVLHNFKQAGGQTSLVVGNRDLFFKSHQRQWPFVQIAEDFLVLDHQNRTLILTHGDLVNHQDKAYKRLRRFVHSSILYAVCSWLPARVGRWCLQYAEKLVKVVHPTTRHYIPQEAWQGFLKNLESKYTQGLCVVGHFHLPELLNTKIGQMQGLVLPDWRQTKTCLLVDSELKWQLQSCEQLRQTFK